MRFLSIFAALALILPWPSWASAQEFAPITLDNRTGSISAEPTAAGNQLAPAPEIYPGWGVLNDLVGQEWREPTYGSSFRFQWAEPGRVLLQQTRGQNGNWNSDTRLIRESGGGIQIEMSGRRGMVEIGADRSFTIVFGGMILPYRQRFDVTESGVRSELVGRGLNTVAFSYDRVGVEPEGAQLAQNATAPIIIGRVGDSPVPAPGPSERSARALVAPVATLETVMPPSESGPIIIASTPPPPVSRRDPATDRVRTTIVTPNSRETQMQQQVQRSRDEAAAEQRRLAEVAAAAEHLAEGQRRREREAERAREQRDSEMWGMIYQGLTLANEIVQDQAIESQEDLSRAIADAEAQAEAERRAADRNMPVAPSGPALGGSSEFSQAQAEQEAADARRQAEGRAAADARQRQAAETRVAQQRAEREAQSAERNRLMDWPEAVVLCSQPPSDGQSRLGNWRCEGPLQMTYVKLDAANRDIALGQACGTDRAVELGTTGAYRAFGCGFGLPGSGRSGAFSDPAMRLGVGYVPGRGIFHCPANGGRNGLCWDR